jgi:hypothetical protein
MNRLDKKFYPPGRAISNSLDLDPPGRLFAFVASHEFQGTTFWIVVWNEHELAAKRWCREHGLRYLGRPQELQQGQ